MRKAKIRYKGEEAGRLTQHDDGSFTYQYDDFWLKDSTKPPISLTLPKSQQSYHSPCLFPFFFNMLPEGANKRAVSNVTKIDENDDFGLLLATAKYDTIGSVTVLKIEEA
jgi:serine/threonine-protein kinase HipA